jgi:hypothetical protein
VVLDGQPDRFCGIFIIPVISMSSGDGEGSPL